MIVDVWCEACNKRVAEVTKEWCLYRRSWIINAWCHGDHVELGIEEIALMNMDEFKFTVFSRPVRVIIDRDLGDEDPGEPWQGTTCRM